MSYENRDTPGISNNNGFTRNIGRLTSGKPNAVRRAQEKAIQTTPSLFDRIKKQLIRGLRRNDTMLVRPQAYEVEISPSFGRQVQSRTNQSASRKNMPLGKIVTGKSGMPLGSWTILRAVHPKSAETTSNLG